MSGPRSTSRVFAALRALHARLDDCAWPPLNGRTPRLLFGGPATDRDKANDLVIINQVPIDDDIEWARMKAGRNELIRLEVIIQTTWPGRSGTQVLDRLEEIADVVQAAFYDTASMTFLPLDGAEALGGVGSINVTVVPVDNGHHGQAIVPIAAQYRI